MLKNNMIFKRTSFFDSATGKIIVLNVSIFILFTLLSLFIDINLLISFLALQPASLIKGEKIWTLLTSMFLHVEFWHLFVNMFSLYFIGSFVEELIGKKRFYIFYIISGIFAGVFWSILSGYLSITPILTSIIGDPLIFGVGASGALFGLIGILAVVTPFAKVFLIAGPILALLAQYLIYGIFQNYGLTELMPYSSILTLFEIIIMIYFIFAIFSMISFNPRTRRIALPIKLEMWVLPIIAIVPLIILSIFLQLPIGNIAHLGGLIAGLLYAYYLKKKYPKKTKMIRGMFK
jgi:membrane associated rhomboid family serine protease